MIVYDDTSKSCTIEAESLIEGGEPTPTSSQDICDQSLQDIQLFTAALSKLKSPSQNQQPFVNVSAS
jgi:hypothetical protein